MGGYFQGGQSGAFWIRNALAGISSNSALARRGVDLLRALMVKRQGQYFLRGGLRQIPGQFSLVGDDDVLPRDWGSFNRRLYRMFHATVLPTILRNFDRLSMAHGIEIRMPFMDWRLVTYTMALPETSKSSDGYTKAIARRAMENRMPRVHPHRAPEGGLQLADAGVVERASFRLDRQFARSEGSGVRRIGGRACTA